MKKIITLVASAFVLNMNAQDVKAADVPAAVKEAFAKQYPNVKNAEWEKEDGNFEAEFKLTRVGIDVKNAKPETIEVSAVYDTGGKFVQSETEIKISELPKAVSEYITSTLAGKKIKEASKITDAAGVVSYEAEVEKTDYIFDANGSFIKKEVEKDNDTDGKKD